MNRIEILMIYNFFIYITKYVIQISLLIMMVKESIRNHCPQKTSITTS